MSVGQSRVVKRLPIGVAVEYSPLGLRLLRDPLPLRGEVIGYSRKVADVVRVKRSNRKTIYNLHADFLRRASLGGR